MGLDMTYSSSSRHLLRARDTQPWDPPALACVHKKGPPKKSSVSSSILLSYLICFSQTEPAKMRLSTLFLLALVPGASAFAPATPKVNAAVQASTALKMGPPTSGVADEETYGEASRKYRRTVYTHDEWVKHRSSDRFVRNLSSIFSSGVYKSIGKEVLATVGVASFIVFWNALTGGYTDLSGVQHDAIITALPQLTLPLTPFTLLSPSLGLLLGE